MRVLHFSDIHLDFELRRVPLRDWLGKRMLGGGNYLLRRREAFRHGRPKLCALVALVRAEKVDLVIFSGDFTTLGTERELLQARAAFEPLIEAAPSFVCIPGNHDIYLEDAIRQGRFERHFGDLLETDLPAERSDGRWPIVRLVGESVAVVAVNSSRPNPRPWRSSGVIPRRQLEALTRLVGDQRLAERFVFVVTHYAPCRPGGLPDTRHHGLRNANALMSAIAPLGERGALLCGHVHHCFSQRLADTAPRIFCAGSATYHGREGLWLFDLDGETQEVVAARGTWSEDHWSSSPQTRWRYAPAP
jgi:3',5'-cyclic AMP phosphodiesterase CpdA